MYAEAQTSDSLEEHSAHHLRWHICVLGTGCSVLCDVRSPVLFHEHVNQLEEVIEKGGLELNEGVRFTIPYNCATCEGDATLLNTFVRPRTVA